VLKSFPWDVRRVLGFGFYQAQEGGKHIDAKPLKGFGGSGILEIVEHHDGNSYRGVYTIKFTGAVYVLHVF
jgi:phage-related protein